ncbi:MAG: hypothetical protein NXI04_17475 [Planctomycetaceae bacterium]|nr:hypothetical protein [Planctomycetaceae bacterium]
MPSSVMGIRADLKSIKRRFVDRPAIINKFDKTALRKLRRVGAMTRTIARRSIRKGGRRKSASQFDPELRRLVDESREKYGLSLNDLDISPYPVRTSAPGKPPKYRNRDLRDKLFFVADLNTRSVITGPQVFDGEDIPGQIEFGGTSGDEAKEWVAFWEAGGRKIRLVGKAGRRLETKPRPFMAPAHEAAIDRLVPGIWQDSIS